MKRIMLLCNAGMSTSLLVGRMQKAAEELNIDCKIWASSEADARSQYDETDVILLGPQVRFLRDSIQNALGERPVRLAVIEPLHYGRMDGAAVLDQALRLLEA